MKEEFEALLNIQNGLEVSMDSLMSLKRANFIRIGDKVKVTNTGEKLVKLYQKDPEKCERIYSKLLKAPEKVDLEIMKKARELLKDRNLINKIKKLLDKEIAGENLNKLLLFLLCVASDVDPQFVIIHGESSGGKSHIVKKVLKLFHKDKHFTVTRISEKDLERVPHDLNNKILFIGEMQGTKAALPTLRQMVSEKKLTLWTVDPSTHEHKEYTKDGCPTIITTSVQAFYDKETVNRSWILSIDESEAQTKRVQQFNKEKMAQNKVEEHKNDIEVLKAVSKVMEEEGVNKIVIPYMDLIQFPTNYVSARRDFTKFTDLIKIITYLYQFQRPKIFYGGEEVIVSTLHDYYLAKELFIRILRPTQSGISQGVINLLRFVPIEGTTTADLAIELKTSQSYARKVLSELAMAGFVIKDRKDNRTNIYIPIKTSDDNYRKLISLKGIDDESTTSATNAQVANNKLFSVVRSYLANKFKLTTNIYINTTLSKININLKEKDEVEGVYIIGSFGCAFYPSNLHSLGTFNMPPEAQQAGSVKPILIEHLPLHEYYDLVKENAFEDVIIESKDIDKQEIAGDKILDKVQEVANLLMKEKYVPFNPVSLVPFAYCISLVDMDLKSLDLGSITAKMAKERKETIFKCIDSEHHGICSKCSKPDVWLNYAYTNGWETDDEKFVCGKCAKEIQTDELKQREVDKFSKLNKKDKIKSILDSVTENGEINYDEAKKEAGRLGLDVLDFDKNLQKMMNEGVLFQPKKNLIRWIE